jgi:Zn-finger nucleic acid-binding protein
MFCPIDDAKLEAASVSGYPIHRCPQCQGIAVSGENFREAQVNAALQIDAAAAPTDLRRSCPADGTGMRALNFKDVAMCACPKCYGLWMDTGHFSRLVAIAGPASLVAAAAIAQPVPAQDNAANAEPSEAWEVVLEIGAEILGAIGDI